MVGGVYLPTPSYCLCYWAGPGDVLWPMGYVEVTMASSELKT